MLKKIRVPGATKWCPNKYFYLFGNKRYKGCPFEMLAPAVLSCFLSVETHIQVLPCCSYLPRPGQSPLGNILIDFAPLASAVLPDSWAGASML